MSEDVLGTYVLSCGTAAFVRNFIEDGAFYEEFLREKLKDIAIEVGQWEADAARSSGGRVVKTRKVGVRFISCPFFSFTAALLCW